MSNAPKATNQQIRSAYSKLRSVWKVGALLGMSGQTVHGRLVAMGERRFMPKFNDADRDRLRRDYLKHRDTGTLAALAKSMGRTRQFICRQARTLGLTSYKHQKRYMSKWKYMTEAEARTIMDNFKAARMGMGTYCRVHGYDDLGFSRTLSGFFPDEWEHVIESKTPLSSKYRRGRQFEYHIRNLLRGLGYFVMRSPASKSPIDLVAIKTGTVLFVQCKTSGALIVSEWNELLDLATSVGAVPVLAFRHMVRQVTYRKLIGPKDGSKRRQPFVPFTP